MFHTSWYLIGAILKNFLRRKVNLALLVVVPLVLISLIFLSFNPEGLMKVPIGVVQDSDSVFVHYEQRFQTQFQLSNYSDLGDCLFALENHIQFVCVVVESEDNFHIRVYYDNTREPVIWEILQLIQATIDGLNQELSREQTESLLDGFSDMHENIVQYEDFFSQSAQSITRYLDTLRSVKIELEAARDTLRDTSRVMKEDLERLDWVNRDLSEQVTNHWLSVEDNLLDFEQILWNMNVSEYQKEPLLLAISQFRTQIRTVHFGINSQFESFNMQLEDYNHKLHGLETFLSFLDNQIRVVDTMSADLSAFQNQLRTNSRSLARLNSDFVAVDSVNIDQLLKPVSYEAQPAYVPYYDEFLDEFESLDSQQQAQLVVRGLNMLSLQTIYPTILFLITIFLSLLISNFISLVQINSSSYVRLRLIRGIFFSDLFSVFFSCLIVVLLPVVFVLVAGSLLFQLSFERFIFEILLVLVLTISFFVLLGMLLAYSIQKESIALLLTTFLLVFFIFVSGMLLPLERMSTFMYFFADNFPAHLSSQMFKQLVFYGQYEFFVQYILSMFGWLLLLFGALILVKRFRA
ncbi:MAG: hypothetical protein ACMXYF_05820 [Candidatus Woesearchaeota archaeon]